MSLKHDIIQGCYYESDEDIERLIENENKKINKSNYILKQKKNFKQLEKADKNNHKNSVKRKSKSH